MAEPVISVVVPSYNYGRFLGECIESVLAQDFGDWEMVITDDRSTDDTEAVVRAYSDPRIRYVRNPTRLGMYPNFRRAVELSRGRLVKVLPADDFLLPGCLRRFHQLFESEPEVVLATCGVRVVDADGELLLEQLLPRPDEVLRAAEVAEMVAAGGNVFGGNAMFCFRRDAYEAVGGYPEDVTYSGDFALAVLLSRLGGYYSIGELLIGGRIHGSQSGVRDTTRTVHVEDRFRIYELAFAPHPGIPRAAGHRALARRREVGLYTTLALRALARPHKRVWAGKVLRLLAAEAGVGGMIAAVVGEAPRIARHFVRTRRSEARKLAVARRNPGRQVPVMEPDPSVGTRVAA